MAHGITLGREAPRTTPRFLRTLAQALRSITHGLFDSYHPERHYMRGPGPKWRAKHPDEERRRAA